LEIKISKRIIMLSSLQNLPKCSQIKSVKTSNWLGPRDPE
jgi:hypothetical protein